MSGKKIVNKVLMSPVFSKVFKKLPASVRMIVDEQIELIIANPNIGEQKKGDLSYLRVLKFKVLSNQYLLGYSLQENGMIVLYLLHLGAHENFYQNAKARRKADLKALTKQSDSNQP